MLILQRLGMVSDLILVNCDDQRPELKQIIYLQESSQKKH